MRYNIRISGQGGAAPVRGQLETARVYTISYEANDSQTAARVANRLAALFVEAGIKARMEQATEISRFLRQELARSDEALRELNSQIAAFNEQYRGELPSELQGNLAKLERLATQKQALVLAIQDLEARMNLRSQDDPNSPAARLASLQAQYDNMLAIRTRDHPAVRTLERQIEVLQDTVNRPDARPTRGGEATALSLANMRRQLAAIESDIRLIDGRVSRTPSRSEGITALTERAGVAREKYLEFLKKVNDAELAQTLEHAKQGAQVSVMDRAFPPSSPETSRTKVVLQALIATLGLAFGAGILTEMLDPVLVAEDQVARIVGAPILGSVGHMR